MKERDIEVARWRVLETLAALHQTINIITDVFGVGDPCPWQGNQERQSGQIRVNDPRLCCGSLDSFLVHGEKVNQRTPQNTTRYEHSPFRWCLNQKGVKKIATWVEKWGGCQGLEKTFFDVNRGNTTTWWCGRTSEDQSFQLSGSVDGLMALRGRSGRKSRKSQDVKGPNKRQSDVRGEERLNPPEP